MRRLLLVFATIIAVPVTVSACEGECIVGITQAFIGNYSNPVERASHLLAEQLSQELYNGAVSLHAVLAAIQPIRDAYQNQVFPVLRNAIFPGYFHGKCQVDGVEPKGCPNPNCPVVCGTPGSLVHFYPTLRLLAFDCLEDLLRKLVTPGSESYRQVVESLLLYAGVSTKNQRVSFANQVREILGLFPQYFKEECGPTLSHCSWEAKMKQFILTFP